MVRFVASKRSHTHLGVLVAHTVSVIGLDWSSPLEFTDLNELDNLRTSLDKGQKKPISNAWVHSYQWNGTTKLFDYFVQLSKVPSIYPYRNTLSRETLASWICARSPDTLKTISQFKEVLPKVNKIQVPECCPELKTDSPQNFLLRLFQYYPSIALKQDEQVLEIYPRKVKCNVQNFQTYFEVHPDPGLGIYDRFMERAELPNDRSVFLSLFTWSPLLQYHKNPPKEKQPNSLKEYWDNKKPSSKAPAQLLSELASIPELVPTETSNYGKLSPEKVSLWLSSKMKQTPALITELYRQLKWLPLKRGDKIKIDLDGRKEDIFKTDKILDDVILRVLGQYPLITSSVTSEVDPKEKKTSHFVLLKADESVQWDFEKNIMNQVRSYAEYVTKKGNDRDRDLVSKWKCFLEK